MIGAAYVAESSFIEKDIAKRAGFTWNRVVAPIGHALARVESLTTKQAVLARKLLRKYRRQFGDADA
jgi:hypothetical protein